MRKLKIILVSAIAIQIACNTLTQPTKVFPTSGATPSEVVVPGSVTAVASVTAPHSFNPHDWADYKLLHEYWPVINQAAGTTIEAAAQSLTQVAYSSTGGYIAVAGCDQAMVNTDDPVAFPISRCTDTETGRTANAFLYILNAGTAEIIASLPPTGTQTTVKCLSFSHDGQKLAYATDSNEAVVWDIASGKIETEIPQPPPTEDSWWLPHLVIFNPDDQLLAVSYGEFIRIWERGTQKFIAEIKDPPYPEPIFSRDGKTVLFLTPPLVTYDATTWEKLYSVMDEFPYWAVMDISPDLAISADAEINLDDEIKNGPVRIYDLKTGDLIQSLDGEWDAAGRVIFTPDGRYLMRIDKTGRGLAVWEVDGWKYSDESSVLANIVSTDDHFVDWLYFSDDGRSLLVSTYARLTLYGLP